MPDYDYNSLQNKVEFALSWDSNAGSFKQHFNIPAHISPYTASTNCIFTLKSLKLSSLLPTNAQDRAILEASHYNLLIQGLGLRNNVFVGGANGIIDAVHNTTLINVLNEHRHTRDTSEAGAGIDLKTWDTQAGNFDIGYQNICSSPFGGQLTCDILSPTLVPLVAENANHAVSVNLVFCVEFVEPDMDKNFPP